MRRPISRVRSVTDTSMMFMMPMPPTMSDTPAMPASSVVIVPMACVRMSAISSSVRTDEVVVLPGHDLVARAQQHGDRVGDRRSSRRRDAADTVMLLNVGDAEQLLLDRRVGHEDLIVHVLAHAAGPSTP